MRRQRRCRNPGFSRHFFLFLEKEAKIAKEKELGLYKEKKVGSSR